MVFASMGWGQESPPSTGTGTPCCRHHAWLHSPGKPVGRRKRSSWRQWHGPCGARGSCPISLHPTASAGRAGCAGNPHLLWECEMHKSLWGHCPATSHMGENTPRCCTSHQHPQPPAPARQGSPGCFPCTPKLPLSGLASACTVSFGSSRNLTPAERKACPTAGCLSTC